MASDVEDLNVGDSEQSLRTPTPQLIRRNRHTFNETLEKMLSDSDGGRSVESFRSTFSVSTHQSKNQSQPFRNEDALSILNSDKFSSEDSDSSEDSSQSYRAGSREGSFLVYTQGVLKMRDEIEYQSEISTGSSHRTTPYQSQRSRIFNEEIPILIDADKQNYSGDSAQNSFCVTPQERSIFREEINLCVKLVGEVEEDHNKGDSARTFRSNSQGNEECDVHEEAEIMNSNVKNNNRGDSNQTPRRISNRDSDDSHHVVNEAGENPSCYASVCKTQNTENKDAIKSSMCAETVEKLELSCSVGSPNNEEITPHPHTTYRSLSTSYLSSGQSSRTTVSRKSCFILDTEHKSDDEESSRIDKTYREEGQDTFRLSVGSLETSTTSREDRERMEMKRKQAFKEWCERKEFEKRERLLRERAKQAMLLRPVTSEAQREESYRLWAERKKKEAMRLKAEEIMMKYKTQLELDALRLKKQRDKEEKLNQWVRKKEETTRDMQQKAEREAARVAALEARRRSEGERAYREWLRSSKHKPLPVPLNKGELSMRGSVSDMYINPVPWQPLK